MSLKKVTIAIIFTVAWIALIIGTLVFVFTMKGLLPFNAFTAYSQMFGMVAEVLLLSYALSYRINLDRISKEHAQDTALVLTDRVSKERRSRIIAQQEALELQKNINEQLEERVRLRTEQYEHAMVQLTHANEDLLYLSITDQLSQVRNRRYFDQTVQDECKRAIRIAQPLAIILVDIDHFKYINDIHGHNIGDLCITQIAQALNSVVNRTGDLLARYGGEEFVYVLPNINESNALIVAEKSRRLIENLVVEHDGHLIPVTASYGVASWVPKNQTDYEQIIKAADNAMYKAKLLGRNCVKAQDHKGQDNN